MGTLYKRGKVYWGRIQIAGREHRATLRTASRTEAKARLAAWAAELTDETRYGIVQRNWDEAVVEFLARPPDDIRPSTLGRYKVSFRAVADALRGRQLREIKSALIARIANRPGVSNATRRRDLTAVSMVFRHAVRLGWLEHNPVRDYDRSLLRERREPIAIPAESEIRAFIAAAHASCGEKGRGTLGYLVEFLLQTGLRLEEAGSLTWGQIDLNRKAVQLLHTKTGRPRAVTLCVYSVALLDSVPRALGCPFVFWHSDGRRYANLSSRLAFLRARLGLAWRTHDLRHLYAIRYLQTGGSIYQLQQELGHRSIQMTECYLSYLTPDEQSAARRSA